MYAIRSYYALHYGAFMTFFPRLIAGPIVRPQQILPQLTAARSRAFASLEKVAASSPERQWMGEAAAMVRQVVECAAAAALCAHAGLRRAECSA